MAEWKVESLTAYPKLDDKENVVYCVHWRCDALDAVTELSLPSGDFIPFEDLTEGIVLGWVWDRISKSGMEALAAKIKEEAENPAPVAVEVKLPWIGSN